MSWKKADSTVLIYNYWEILNYNNFHAMIFVDNLQ